MHIFQSRESVRDDSSAIDIACFLQLAEGFAAKLQSGHGETCTWRTGGCNPQLACFPPITPDAALAGFHRRASSIAALGALPCLQLQPGTLPASLWSRCRSVIPLKLPAAILGYLVSSFILAPAMWSWHLDIPEPASLWSWCRPVSIQTGPLSLASPVQLLAFPAMIWPQQAHLLRASSIANRDLLLCL